MVDTTSAFENAIGWAKKNAAIQKKTLRLAKSSSNPLFSVFSQTVVEATGLVEFAKSSRFE